MLTSGFYPQEEALKLYKKIGELGKSGGNFKSKDEIRRLAREYAWLVKHIAGRLSVRLPCQYEYREIVQQGMLGLMDAILRYSSKEPEIFKRQAYLRIRGSIVDWLRTMDWAPRNLREQASLLSKIYRALEEKFGRSATDEEVARELGISIEHFHILIAKINSLAILSLEEVLKNDGEQLIDTDPRVDPYFVAQDKELRLCLTRAVKRLPMQEKLVVALYYSEGFTIKEIGEILDLSYTSTHRLHTQAILRLRGALKDWE